MAKGTGPARFTWQQEMEVPEALQDVNLTENMEIILFGEFLMLSQLGVRESSVCNCIQSGFAWKYE